MSAPLVFVSQAGTVGAPLGGVQICTDEFVRTLRAAGFDLRLILLEPDRRLLARLRRRLLRDPYPRHWDPRVIPGIVRAAAGADLVCLNLVNLAPLASALRVRLRRDCKIVLLSHGLESVDYLHAVPPSGWSRAHVLGLGRRILQERAQRVAIDHVFCLTPYEAEIERWLGAKSVTAIPRTALDIAPLDWHPDPHRLGFVGTLDHPPTRQGLTRLLEAMTPIASSDLEVRIVGGPEPLGRELAARFGIVRYLGSLDDPGLRMEAASWSAFLHPMFCWARGCSTKLAVALAWQLPIVTTTAGARGYAWKRGALSTADTPETLAALACRLTDPTLARKARDEVLQVGRTMPTVAEAGALIRAALRPDAVARHEVRV